MTWCPAGSGASAAVGGLATIQVKAPTAPNWGRRWLIEPRHDSSDVISTLWLAIQTMETHERYEGFKIDGVKVWDPHLPVL